jgi:hypothetical protein
VKARRHERKQGQSKELNKRAGNSLSEHLHKDLLRRFRLLFQQSRLLMKRLCRMLLFSNPSHYNLIRPLTKCAAFILILFASF